MKNLTIILVMLIFAGCVSSGTFNDTIGDVNSRINSLEMKLSDANYDLSQLRNNNKSIMNELIDIKSSINTILNSTQSNFEKLKLLDDQYRRLDDIVAQMRIEFIRQR